MPWKRVGAGLGHHVDGAAARPADLSRKPDGIHLEFLHRVLAERIRAEAGAAHGLPKEQVIAIGAVHQHRVDRAALTGEGDVARAAHVADRARRGQQKIDEVAPVQR